MRIVSFQTEFSGVISEEGRDRLERRTLLKAALALPFASPRIASADDTGAIKIGQTVSLSGAQSDLGQAISQGAKAHFSEVNARGGVFGRPIELVAVDDGYDVKRALANTRGFIEDRSIFALFGCQGTPSLQAMLPMVIESGFPLFAPFSGSSSIRPSNVRNVLNIRASYADEVDKLVEHLHIIGIRRMGLVYLNNSFGKEILAATEGAMSKRGLNAVVAASVEVDGEDAASAASKMSKANPEALLLGLAGTTTAAVVKALRLERKGMALYGLSVLGSAATLNSLGAAAVGITMSQVVPLPTHSTIGVVRDFRSAWRATSSTLEPSHIALEGYINAKAFVAALTRAGPVRNRQRFIDAVWSLKNHDLGEFFVNFTEPGKSASRFVELTMVAGPGKFIR